MLRYFYLLSLFMYVNVSFCYEYTLDNDPENKPIVGQLLKEDFRHRRKNVQHRKHRKRNDYDETYYKEPEAQLDMANFMNNEEDNSLSESDPYSLQEKNMRYGINYDYGSLSDEKLGKNDFYTDTDAEKLRDNSEHLQSDSLLTNKVMSEKLRHGLNSVERNNFDDDDLHRKNNVHRQQKKCAMKNIKLPFFSHNKSDTYKGKKDKKRKHYNFRFNHPKKEKDISKTYTENLPKQSIAHGKSNQRNYYSKNKRSYIERICPICKRKFIANKSNINTRGTIHDKYDTENNEQDETNSESETTNSNQYEENIDNPATNEEINVEGFWRNERLKREGDDRNLERQRELENLEKSIESVTEHNVSKNISKS